MFTVSDIMADISRGCAVNNLNENAFSYRIVFFVNEGSASKKYYADAQYDGLRISLENIVRKNLTTTNTVVLAALTARKNSEIVSLLSRSYLFSMEEYFRQLTGKRKNRNNTYSNRRVQAIYYIERR